MKKLLFLFVVLILSCPVISDISDIEWIPAGVVTYYDAQPEIEWASDVEPLASEEVFYEVYVYNVNKGNMFEQADLLVECDFIGETQAPSLIPATPISRGDYIVLVRCRVDSGETSYYSDMGNSITVEDVKDGVTFTLTVAAGVESRVFNIGIGG